MSYDSRTQSHTITIPANMEPGQTLVVPGLGRLTLEYGHKKKLKLKAAAIICRDKQIICFQPTEKSVLEAKACIRCHVAELKITDPSGTFYGNATIDNVEYHVNLQTLLITERR